MSPSTASILEQRRRAVRGASTGRKEVHIKALELAQRVRAVLVDKKGADIRLFDVRKISEIADYMLVVSGSSPPHLKAMFSETQHTLKAAGVHCYRSAGTPDCGWMLVDYVDVVIHIFSPAARAYYAIEELWARGRLLD